MRSLRSAARRRPTFHSAEGGRPVLEMSGVTVEYGGAGMSRGAFRAVDDVSLTIVPGRSLGLVGESGCGKTSLGRAVVGLTPLSQGTISVAGRPGLDRARFARRLAGSVQMVFQDPYSSLDPRQRIRDAVAEPMVVHRVGNAAQRRARVDELLARVGLDGLSAEVYPHELSGGQRQRVCVARALAVEPRLVVCDEPTSALDVSIQAQVVTLLQELQDDSQLTYLFITHDLALLPQLVSDVAVMYLGRLVEHGPAEVVLRRPVHPYTVSLIEAVPELGRRRTPGTGHVLSGEATSATALAGCRFRPRCWRYAEIDSAGRALCETVVPPMQSKGPDVHATACHHQPTNSPQPPTTTPVAVTSAPHPSPEDHPHAHPETAHTP